MSLSKLNWCFNLNIKSYSTFLKLATIPLAGFMWYLYYKSKQNNKENLYFIKSICSEKTTSAEGFKVIRVKVPNRAVGAVIGKDGLIIKRLQQMTRTTINFVERPVDSGNSVDAKNVQNEFWDNDKDGLADADSLQNEELMIRGLASNVDEAEKKILEIIKSVPVIISEDMQIDKKFIGRIVGRNGDSIHKLRNTHRVKIDIERDVPSIMGKEASPWRRLTIKGLPDQVEAAKSAITSLILESEEIARSGFKNSKPILSVTSNKSKSPFEDSNLVVSNSEESSTIQMKSHEDVQPVGDMIPLVNDMDFDKDLPSQSTSSTPLPSHLECLPQATTCVFPSDTTRWYKVMVSSVSNCSNFFIHLVVPETRQLEPLVTELTSYFSSLTYQVKDSDLYIGQIIAGFYAPDNTWQRARIVSFKDRSSRCSSVDSDNKNNDLIIDVDYVDYGDCASLPIQKVFPLVQKQFLELPFQAIRVILHGIEPAEGPFAEWSEEAISYLEECVMGLQWQVLHARRCVPSIPGATPYVELEDRRWPDKVISIAAKLVDSGYAKWSSDCV